MTRLMSYLCGALLATFAFAAAGRVGLLLGVVDRA